VHRSLVVLAFLSPLRVGGAALVLLAHALAGGWLWGIIGAALGAALFAGLIAGIEGTHEPPPTPAARCLNCDPDEDGADRDTANCSAAMRSAIAVRGATSEPQTT
jgi:hypothetical protein